MYLLIHSFIFLHNVLQSSIVSHVNSKPPLTTYLVESAKCYIVLAASAARSSSFFCSFSIVFFTACFLTRSLLRFGCAVRDSPCIGSTGWGHITILGEEAHMSQR